MADLPTTSDLLDAGQGALRTALDPAGTGAVNLRAGSKNDTLLSVAIALQTRGLSYASARIAAARLSSATDTDLDTVGMDLFGEPRKDVAFAIGTAYLQRSGTAATVIPAGTRVAVPAAAGQSAVVFNTTADVSVGASVLTATAAIQAAAAGAASNVPLASVTAILDALPDTTWTLYVPISGPPPDTIGFGADAETDDVYRARLQQLAINATVATQYAILQAALAVPGVMYATAVEPLDGTVVLYVGDAQYGLPAAGVTLVTQALLTVRALGLPVLVRPYAATVVSIAARAYMTRALTNYDVAGIQAAAYAAITDLFTGSARAEEYYLSAIEAAVFKGDPEVQDVQLDAPASNSRRPPDTGYGSITALVRYYVTPSSVSITVLPPQTT